MEESRRAVLSWNRGQFVQLRKKLDAIDQELHYILASILYIGLYSMLLR